MGALYVYVILLLCRCGMLNEKKGLYLLDVVKKSTQLEECRARAKSFTLTMWVIKQNFKYEELKIYFLETCCKKTEVGIDKDWSDTYFGEVESDKHYQTSMVTNEVSTFCRIFKQIIMFFNYGQSDFDTQYTFPSFSFFFSFQLCLFYSVYFTLIILFLQSYIILWIFLCWIQSLL